MPDFQAEEQKHYTSSCQPGNTARFDLSFKFKAVFWAAVLLIQFLKVWVARFEMTVDGVSYLDVGDAYFRGNWKSAINAYWSPLYSWVLVFARQALHVPISWESRFVHLLNFFIGAAVLVCFEYFLDGLIESNALHVDVEGLDRLPPWALRSLCYALFLYGTMKWLAADLVSPDLLVEGIVFLASGIILRIHAGNHGFLRYATLGFFLGIGYLTKAILFPLGIVFLLGSFLAARRRKRALPGALVATTIFLVIAAPFIAALHEATGRITVGETGRLNYIWQVNGLNKYGDWQVKPTPSGVALHTMRLVLPSPPMYEISKPEGGSYPPWYDPFYWYEGASPYFRLRQQLSMIRNAYSSYRDLFLAMSEFIVAWVAMCLLAPAFKALVRRFASLAFLWVPAATACILYSSFNVESRFLAAFLIILWGCLFCSIVTNQSEMTQKLVWCLTLSVVITAGIRLSDFVVVKAGHVIHGQENAYGAVAADLRRKGVRPGDHVAAVGEGSDAYWARLAGVQIVAEVPSMADENPWPTDEAARTRIFGILRDIGVKAIVGYTLRRSNWPPDWQQVGKTEFFLHDVPEPEAHASP